MLGRLLKGAIELIYPEICILCKEKLTHNHIDNLICPGCWEKIERITPPFCIKCGRKLTEKDSEKNICSECSRRKFYFERAYACLKYEGYAKRLIHLFKYSGRIRLKIPLSRLLIRHAKDYCLPTRQVDFIVPIPLHARKLREREFNQTLLLSEKIAEEFGLKILDGLCRIKYSRPQVELNSEQRAYNVKGCFSVKERRIFKGKSILLFDDVMTTQATVQEASRVLKEAGCSKVYVYTLAN